MPTDIFAAHAIRVLPLVVRGDDLPAILHTRRQGCNEERQIWERRYCTPMISFDICISKCGAHMG